MRQTTLTEQRRPLIKSACAQLLNGLQKTVDRLILLRTRGSPKFCEHQSTEKTHNNDKNPRGVRKKKENDLAATKHVALTGDPWTSVSNDNYLGVTAHLITNEWKLKSFTLTCMKTEELHFAEACAQQFQTVASNWAIEDKTTTIGIDSARNMIAAARLL